MDLFFFSNLVSYSSPIVFASSGHHVLLKFGLHDTMSNRVPKKCNTEVVSFNTEFLWSLIGLFMTPKAMSPYRWQHCRSDSSDCKTETCIENTGFDWSFTLKGREEERERILHLY